MSDLFNSANFVDGEPRRVIEGTLWAWKRGDLVDYPDPTYALEYRLSQQDAPYSDYVVPMLFDGTAWYVEEAGGAGIPPSEYRWRLFVIRSTDQVEISIGQGWLLVKPNNVGSGDTRSYNYRVLMAIRHTIEGTASHEEKMITIGQRTIERRSIDELLALEAEFARRWKKEQEDEGLEDTGTSTKSTVLVGMSGR